MVYEKFANKVLNLSSCQVVWSWRECLAGLRAVNHSLRKDYPHSCIREFIQKIGRVFCIGHQLCILNMSYRQLVYSSSKSIAPQGLLKFPEWGIASFNSVSIASSYFFKSSC